MRNIIGIKGDGTMYNIDYAYPLENIKNLSKTFFTSGGEIRCIRLLDVIKDVYNNICPSGIDKNIILNAKDDIGIIMIYNEYESSEKPWKYNDFLSNILTYPVYADDIVIITTEDELKRVCNVTDEQNEFFIEQFNYIIDICHEVIDKSYLSSINLMINNDNIITLSYKDSADFQEEYIGKKQECNFLEAVQISERNFMASKSGIMMLQTDNNGEIYFTQRFVDNNGMLMEIIC